VVQGCNLFSGTILNSTNAYQATYRVPRETVLSALIECIVVDDCSHMPQSAKYAMNM
jgi:hypothetical protein